MLSFTVISACAMRLTSSSLCLVTGKHQSLSSSQMRWAGRVASRSNQCDQHTAAGAPASAAVRMAARQPHPLRRQRQHHKRDHTHRV